MNTRIRKNRQRRLNDETAPLIARNHDECDCIFISLYFSKNHLIFTRLTQYLFPDFSFQREKKTNDKMR